MFESKDQSKNVMKSAQIKRLLRSGRAGKKAMSTGRRNLALIIAAEQKKEVNDCFLS